jgi:hypothetical protein
MSSPPGLIILSNFRSSAHWLVLGPPHNTAVLASAAATAMEFSVRTFPSSSRVLVNEVKIYQVMLESLLNSENRDCGSRSES